MANLIAVATGNFTASGTWALVDSTSYLNSEATTVLLTTSLQSSSNFTPGAITIDGFALRVYSRAASPSGTMTVDLYNSSLAAQVAGTQVVINVSDLQNFSGSGVDESFWVFFKFSAPVLLLAATNYQIRAMTSQSTQVTLVSSTAANYSRQLRTTTTQAPVAADILTICGERTGAGTSNAITVTMNETATTAYGDIYVSDVGTLAYGKSDSTNYYLKLTGDLRIFSGGTFTIASSGSRLDATSTAVLEFNSGSAAQYGLRIHSGTVSCYGATKTRRAFLAADAIATATSLTTDVSTGWKNTDNIGIASTARNAGSQSETKALTADASGTTLTIAALTNAHLGTSPMRAELINTTGNVKIRGMSTTNTTYIGALQTAAMTLDQCEIYNLGSGTSSGTTDKFGITPRTTTGSFTMAGCAIYNTHSSCYIHLFNNNITTTNNVSISNCVYYGCAGAAIIYFNSSLTASPLSFSVTNCWIVGGAATVGLHLLSYKATCTGIRICGTTGQSTFVYAAVDTLTGTFDDLTVHSVSNGHQFQAGIGGTNKFTNLTAYRCDGNFYFNGFVGLVEIDTTTTWGAATGEFYMAGVRGVVRVANGTFDAKASSGDASVSPRGIYFSSAGTTSIMFLDSCKFGNTYAFTTADMDVSASLIIQVVANNCLFTASTELNNQGNLRPSSYISSSKHDQTAGSHKTWMRECTITNDSTFYGSATPGMRITPRVSTEKGSLLYTNTGGFLVPVASGNTCTVQVKVRESVSGDGAAYNGARARLIVLANHAAGITSNTVLATATSASSGAFETISGTTAAVTDDCTLEFIVDCDGTAGWITTDDFDATANAADPLGFKYWLNGTPAVMDIAGSGGGAGYIWELGPG